MGRPRLKLRGAADTLVAVRLMVAALGLAAAAAPGAAQPSPGLHDFLDAVERETRRFEDVGVAIAEGYRRLGPDFPGMGEHWIHPGLVIGGELDPSRPPVVAYTMVGARRLLVGVAFTRVLGPDDDVPSGPFPRHAWHDHTGGVDEESLLLAGPASMHPSDDGYRLSMVHVWWPLTNPMGVLAQNNWALPFHRAGLATPEEVSSEAGRALSLAGVGAPFYDVLLRDAIGLRGADLESALTAFAVASRRARTWVETDRTDVEALEAIWSELWRDLEATVSDDGYRAIRVLRHG